MMQLALSFLLLTVIVSPIDYYCNVNSSTYPSTITIGNPFVICVHFVDSTGSLKRAAFPITVDKYTALSLNGAYTLMSPNSTSNKNITLQAQNSNVIRQSIFYSSNINRIAQLFSFVIFVNNGVIVSIDDNNAPFCNDCSGQCWSYPNEGGQSMQNCYVDTTVTGKDPKIFVSWMGTDSSGQYLLSQAQRIEKFTQYSMNNVFESALNIFK